LQSTEPKKPGPKPKARIEPEALQARIDQLEKIIIKLAHFTGTNRILIENGIEPWSPDKASMNKFRGK
jgi:hypothetical protein